MRNAEPGASEGDRSCSIRAPAKPLANQDGLGVGLVWWPALEDLCRPGEHLVDVIEVEPETWWLPTGGGRGYRSLLPEVLRRVEHPVILHGVGAPLGGGCDAPTGHGAVLAGDVAAIRPAFVSEHLSFTHGRQGEKDTAIFAGVMLPPAQSADGVGLAAANIARHRARLNGAPLAIETPVSYLPPAPGEWPDGMFMAAVARKADCGIVLDLRSLLCNARNGRQSVESYCGQIPLDRVWELHLAGGEARDGFWLDAHCGVAEPELMAIARDLAPRLPALRAITLEILPEHVPRVGLAAIAHQLGELREIWLTRGSRADGLGWLAEPPATQAGGLAATEWERVLGAALTGLPGPVLDGVWDAWRGAAAAAFSFYRTLAGEGRASSVAAAAPRCTRLLLEVHGRRGAREILAQYWRRAPPGYTIAQEAAGFLRFLATQDHATPGLGEAMAEDMARLGPLGVSV